MAINKARDYTLGTIKRLFMQSGNLCANPNCQTPLSLSNGTIIAEICHIEAASPGGERYNPHMTDDERRDFDNLIILCANCHIITDNIIEYTVERLKLMKKEHEEFILTKNKTIEDIVLIDKIIKKFAYDFDYTEREDWGILEEIINFVNSTQIGNNKKFDEIKKEEGFATLAKKVGLNFPSDQRLDFSDLYTSSTAKMEVVKSYFNKISEEDSGKIDELIEFIKSKYREIKNTANSNARVDDINVISILSNELIPEMKRNSPQFIGAAKALVIHVFEFCNIGMKTPYELGKTISLFDDL